MNHDYDLLVIGGGSGGVRAARMAAQRGLKVALAEVAALGGTCVNVGCIPKKLYSYAAHYHHAFAEARGYGWEGQMPQLNWAHLKQGRAAEVARLNGVYRNLLDNAGVQLLQGWARLLDGHTAAVRLESGEVRVTARHILIATGGTPSIPQVPGQALAMSSNHMFDLEPFPRHLAVVGAGYIACEFASIFRSLGAQVTQLVRGEQVLRGFDEDVRGFVSQELQRNGIAMRLRTEVAAIDGEPGALHLALTDASTLACDAVLFATGRVPNVDELGLQAAGIAQSPKDGAIVVDDRYRTNVESVYAVGDVTARVQLTPVALAEAMVVVDQLCGDGRRRLGYDNIPTAVFTHPNVGTVGLTEQQARQRHGEVHIFRSDFKPLRHTLSGSGERVFMKLVVDAKTDRVLGLHMVGPEAGEVVQGFAVALQAGATKAQFDATVGIHPTVAEEFVTMRTPVS